MDKLIEQSLSALLAREGLEPKEGDLEQFSKIIDLYMATLKRLHSVNLGVFALPGFGLSSAERLALRSMQCRSVASMGGVHLLCSCRLRLSISMSSCRDFSTAFLSFSRS